MMIFGGLLSAPPIISLIQKRSQVALTPILLDFLNYYRKLFYPVIDVALYLLTFAPWLDIYALLYSSFMSPEVYKDLTALSLIFTTAFLRVAMDRPKLRSLDFGYFMGLLIITFYVVGCALTLIGLANPIIFITRDPETKKVYKNYIISLVIALIAATAFYATNELIK
jgi:hypothetical protein